MKGRKLLVFAFSLLIALTIGCGEKSDKKADQNIVKDSAALDQAAKTI
ncbi:MAG: hypothetical protein JNN15_14965, partial [Blastocatellia bacterium]|nr:hypothetical protein [Blastocatellia bacterium]